MFKIFKMFFYLILLIFLLSIAFLTLGFSKEKENLDWGVNFSIKHTKSFGLDFKKVYLAILDDLKVDNIKLAVHWDTIEKKEGEYYFEEIDFVVDQAEERNIDMVLVVGMKTSRWPECHIPQFAKDLEKELQQKKILDMIEKVILRYKDKKNIIAWQIENEPFFTFGDCPWKDIDFLEKEVNFVKSIDDRPIIVSETGEFSSWFKSGKVADMVGVTMYRKAWFKELERYVSYPFSPTFYKRKALIIDLIFGKEVIGVELQAEPWGPSLLYDSPIEEQEKSMNINQFRDNISFAKKVGFRKNYLWGVEWWYLMKEKYDKPIFWEEAKKLWQ